MPATSEYVKLAGILSAHHERDGLVTFAVTSSNRKEGASTVAAHTATHLARHGTVLLVDANRYSPAIHRFFGRDNGLGLSDFVSGNAAFESIVRTTDVPNLSIVTAGQSDGEHRVAMISADGLRAYITECTGRFDVTIFDIPATNDFPDIVVWSPRVDGVVLVVEAGKTRWEAARNACMVCRKSYGRIIGAVLNKKTHAIPSFLYGQS
ncbi:MAG: hypothetical protein GF344_09110 [Chitinivibrionales bacterium]|nr:hypothetical protein [Chitinivibrionales bacterium]